MITRATLELRTLRTTLALRVLVHGVHGVALKSSGLTEWEGRDVGHDLIYITMQRQTAESGSNG